MDKVLGFRIIAKAIVGKSRRVHGQIMNKILGFKIRIEGQLMDKVLGSRVRVKALVGKSRRVHG